jgi:hypothetical protein
VLNDHLDVAAVGQHPDVIKGVALYQHQVSSSTSGQLTKLTLREGFAHATAHTRQQHVTAGAATLVHITRFANVST